MGQTPCDIGPSKCTQTSLKLGENVCLLTQTTVLSRSRLLFSTLLENLSDDANA